MPDKKFIFKFSWFDLKCINELFISLNFDLTNWQKSERIIYADIMKQLVKKFSLRMLGMGGQQKTTVTLSPGQAEVLKLVMQAQQEFSKPYEIPIILNIISIVDTKQ